MTSSNDINIKSIGRREVNFSIIAGKKIFVSLHHHIYLHHIHLPAKKIVLMIIFTDYC